MPTPRDTALREYDAMQCRSCGREERASEGYPCAVCGTFICLMCVFKGVVRCGTCEAQATRTPVPTVRSGSGTSGGARPVPPAPPSAPSPLADWPEH